jgi:hypothetical protein
MNNELPVDKSPEEVAITLKVTKEELRLIKSGLGIAEGYANERALHYSDKLAAAYRDEGRKEFLKGLVEMYDKRSDEFKALASRIR